MLSADASGVFIIAATPFADDGALDLAGLDRLVDWYEAHGVDGLTILGSWGSPEAHQQRIDGGGEAGSRSVDRARGGWCLEPWFREHGRAGRRGDGRGGRRRHGRAARNLAGRRGRSLAIAARQPGTSAQSPGSSRTFRSPVGHR